MATGDQTDILERLKATLPKWFDEQSANLEILLSGPSSTLSLYYTLHLWLKSQTRLNSMSGVFLDIASYDMFGTDLPRESGEEDATYLARIKAYIVRPAATKDAISEALETLTGYAPVMYEPRRAPDCGGYGIVGGYGVAGAYGSLDYPCQGFVTVFRDPDTITDQQVYDVINKMKAEGVLIWTRIIDGPSALGYFVLDQSSLT